MPGKRVCCEKSAVFVCNRVPFFSHKRRASGVCDRRDCGVRIEHVSGYGDRLGNVRNPNHRPLISHMPVLPPVTPPIRFVSMDALFPAAEPGERRPILLFGDDLGWLTGRVELAGREILLADSREAAHALITTRPLDCVVASCADPGRSVEMLRAAGVSERGTVALVIGDGKRMSGVSCPFPLLPRVESVDVLDDQVRTQLAIAAWQAKPALSGLLKLITQVPTLPGIYTQITAALQNPHISVQEIADLVAREPAVSAKLLQMVNSPLFTFGGSVTSVRDATSLLGLNRVRSLVMATCLFRQFDVSKCRSFSMSRFEETSLRIANWASTIALSETGNKHLADMAFTGGLLHNFGVLLLAANIPIAYEEVLRNALKRQVSLALSEFQTFGATHAALGGGFLASWRIPFPIVNAVGWYPFPSSSEDTAFTPLTAVHAATAVDAFAQTGMYAYDRGYIEKMGLCEKVEHWCASLTEETLAA